MINLFKREIGIKITSVFFAILLWLFVLDNIDNPFEKKNLDVGINILNVNTLEEKNLGLEKQLPQTYVQVETKGRKDKTAGISASDIEASVDFSTIKEAGYKELPIRVTSKINGVEVTIVKPTTLNVTVEKVISKTIPVEVIQNGKMKENYIVYKVTPQMESVTVEGVESIVNQAVVARTDIDISTVNKSITLKKDYKVYGQNNEELPELSKNSSIEVTVDVAKEVAVLPTIKGKPANDFIITNYNTNKDRVLITGFPEQLDVIDELSTETVNVENISKNSNIITFIKIPDGVKLVDSQKDITVTVNVEQLRSKEFQVDKAAVLLQNIDEAKFLYEVVPDTFKFTIKGRETDIAGLNSSSFKVTVDLTGITEGTVKLPVKIILPNNDINRVDDNTIEMNITAKNIQ